MENKITMAMPLSEIPFIYDRDETLRILKDEGIYNVSDLVEYTKDELLNMGINGLSYAYLDDFLVANHFHLREEGERPINILHAHLTPEVWERRRYEVAKDILLKKLGTYGDYEDARSEEMHDSIDLATDFIRILKISSEAEMQDGDWR